MPEGDRVNKLLDRATDLAHEHLPDDVLGPALDMVTSLRPVAPQLEQQGEDFLRDFLLRLSWRSLLEVEAEVAARSFRARRAALLTAVSGANTEWLRRVEQRAQILDALQDVGQVALKAAVPLLLAAL